MDPGTIENLSEDRKDKTKGSSKFKFFLQRRNYFLSFKNISRLLEIDSCISLTKCADIKATKLFSHLCLAGVEIPEEQESRVSVSQKGVESWKKGLDLD